MSSIESDTRSGSGKKNTSERKHFDMKKMSFYNPELLSKRKVIINNSTSKEMFSFPTTKRFPDFIRDDSPFFYNIPTTITKRSTSFGFGTKVAFPDNNKYPGPGAYDQLLKINKKGRYIISELPNSIQNTFGSEIRFKNNSTNTETPAPNAYNPESLIKGNGIIYNSRYKTKLGKSMGQRLRKIGEKLITPGPGSYDHMNMNLEGKYPSSTLSNSILNKFGNEKRFIYSKGNETPAPNAYWPESMTKGNGIIYNSRYNTNLGKSMSWKLNELSKSTTPGPGAYEFFSEFEGFYKYRQNKQRNSENNSKNENNDNNDDNDNKKDNDNENNEGEVDNGSGSGKMTGKGSSDSEDESSNGKDLKEVFGKEVNEEISKVKIKKLKLE